MENNPLGSTPPPMPLPATTKRPVSGWAIAAIVGAVLLVPLLPVIFGVIALAKICNSGGRTGGTVLAVVAMVLGGVELVGILAALAAPVILRSRMKAQMTMATSNALQVNALLFQFSQDWGEFPSRKIFEENREQFPGLLESDDANFYLGMLIAGGYTKTEECFYTEGGSATHKRPDNVITPPQRLLEAGECGFGYVLTADGKVATKSVSGAFPLLVYPLMSGSGGRDPIFNSKPYDGRAFYLNADGSVQMARIQNGKVVMNSGGGRFLFETGPGTVWGEAVPDVKAPR